MSTKWTPEESARLHQMADAGKTCSEIAKALGRTVKAVEHKRYAYRNPKPRTSFNTTRKVVLSEQEQKWLINHFKHTKNDEIMMKLGLSHGTLHRIAREYGLTKSRQFVKKTQAEGMLRAHETNRRNNWPPKGYRIPNCGVRGFKPGVTPEQRLGKKKNAERIAKSTASRNKTIASERRRILFGLDQQTKLKLVYNRDRALYRYALKKRGYIVERGGREAIVVETTVRSKIVEQRASKHGIKIVV